MDVAVLASRRAGAIFCSRNHPDGASGHLFHPDGASGIGACSRIRLHFGLPPILGCILGFASRGCVQLGGRHLAVVHASERFRVVLYSNLKQVYSHGAINQTVLSSSSACTSALLFHPDGASGHCFIQMVHPGILSSIGNIDPRSSDLPFLEVKQSCHHD